MTLIDYTYLRTSSKDKTPEDQRPEVLSTVPQGITITEVIEKQSAWKDTDNLNKRPGFAEIYKNVALGRVRSVNVWDLDRIYRNRKALVRFMELCNQKKVIVRSYRQQFLLDIEKMPAPWNEIVSGLMIQIYGNIAEEESNKKSDRVKKAFANKGENERWGRRPIPQTAVSKVLDLHRANVSLRNIAKQVTYTDKNKKPRNLSLGAVHKIITAHKAKKEVEVEGVQLPVHL